MDIAQETDHKKKRSKLYINRSFQTGFILKFILIVVVGGAISIALTLLACKETLTTSFMNSRLVIQSTSHAIMPSVVYTNLVTTGILALVVVLVTLAVSHKIAGPMFRFQKDIEKIASGDLKSRISIRNGDQLKEMATALNLMVENLNQKVVAIQNEVAVLGREAEASETPSDVMDKIRSVESRIDQLFEL